MNVRDLHDWNVAPAEAKRLQCELRARISLTCAPPLAERGLDGIRTVAGVDNAYTRSGSDSTAYAAVVVLSFPALEVIESRVATAPVTFPYVPGLLSFREAPAILAAFRALAVEPDVVLFDGQGYAHPRRLGLASHLGLALDRPSVGVAKSRLIGVYREPAPEFGAREPLIDGTEVVGAVVRTRPSHAPLFVSPGHKIDVDAAVDLVLACCRDDNFLPEPTRLAHNFVGERAHPPAPRSRKQRAAPPRFDSM